MNPLVWIKDNVLTRECRLTASARLVALAVADRMNKDGICFASKADIVARTGLSRATVTRALGELCDGLDAVFSRSTPGETCGRPHRCNRFTLKGEAAHHEPDTSHEAAHHEPDQTDMEAHSEPGGGSPRAGYAAHSEPQNYTHELAPMNSMRDSADAPSRDVQKSSRRNVRSSPKGLTREQKTSFLEAWLAKYPDRTPAWKTERGAWALCERRCRELGYDDVLARWKRFLASSESFYRNHPLKLFLSSTVLDRFADAPFSSAGHAVSLDKDRREQIEAISQKSTVLDATRRSE